MVNNRYDPFGRRLWKEVSGTRTYFAYANEGLIGEYTAAGAEIKTYGYKPGSTWTTDPLYMKIGSEYYWYQNDHAGTPQKLIATSGLVVWDGKYDAFGNCQVEIEGITNNLRFAGQYYDAETGLHYNLNRYYDPVLGRYLRSDPFGEGLNLYAYCFNNPNGLIDPLGLCAIKNFGTLQGQANFWAGFGDTITLGGTKWIRDQWNQAYGWSDSVNYSSGTYSAGKWSGYALEAGLGIAGSAKLIGKNILAIGSGIKVGGIAGGIVGTSTFGIEILKGNSVEKAFKSSVISGVTATVSVGSAASGARYIITSIVSATVNAELQYNLNGKIEKASVLWSAFGTTTGSAILSTQKITNEILKGYVYGKVGASVSLLGDVFSETAR